MALFIGNAFSLNMVSVSDLTKVQFEPLTLEQAKDYVAKATSVVGHADTAVVFSDVLGAAVDFNRCSLTLTQGDTLIVGQYKGPRLEEGCKNLPEGAAIEWVKVSLPIQFSWDDIVLTEEDIESRDINHIADEYETISLSWLINQFRELSQDESFDVICEMLDCLPAVKYGESLWVNHEGKWIEIWDNQSTGETWDNTRDFLGRHF